MADTNDDHMASVAKEFQQVAQKPPTPGEKKRPKQVRVHSSIYLERSLLDRLSEAHKTTNHELYPLEVRKSTFVEACIAYALNHLPEVKTLLNEDVRHPEHNSLNE